MNFIKIKNISTSKDHEDEKAHVDWEKIFMNHISKIKNSYNSVRRTAQLKKRANGLNQQFIRENI